MALALLLVAAAIGAACSTSDITYRERLHPCRSDEGPNGAWCGMLPVFENRDAGTSRRIDLAIVVLPATTDEVRPDPLVFLAGGPGQAAAQMADTVGPVFSRVRRHRDIVLVDQRGTGASNGLDCPERNDRLGDLFAGEDAAAAHLRACLEQLDADVRFYTTPLAMHDLDDVRAHLGYDSVTLYGGSYGTRAALVYLRQYPDRVRAMVLDGVAPTGMRLPLFASRDASAALDAWLSSCAAEPGCAAAFPRIREQVETLLRRLEANPPRVTIRHPRTGVLEDVRITARPVASILFGALYSHVTAPLVPMLVSRAAMDDFAGLLALAFASDTSESISLGMQLSVLCSEDAPRVDPADVRRASAGTVFGDHLIAGQLQACGLWPRGDVPDDYYEPVRSNVPTLILSGELDPVTPPRWGESVAQHLSRARHLTAPATAHGVAGTPCGQDLIADFVETADPASLDVACLDDRRPPPFFLTPAGPDPRAAADRAAP